MPLLGSCHVLTSINSVLVHRPVPRRQVIGSGPGVTGCGSGTGSWRPLAVAHPGWGSAASRRRARPAARARPAGRLGLVPAVLRLPPPGKGVAKPGQVQYQGEQREGVIVAVPARSYRTVRRSLAPGRRPVLPVFGLPHRGPLRPLVDEIRALAGCDEVLETGCGATPSAFGGPCGTGAAAAPSTGADGT